MEGCTKSKVFLVKILKNGIRYKIKKVSSFLLKFWHKTHFNSKNMFKKLNFKNLIWTPKKKNFEFPPISPIFSPKFPNRDLRIFFHTWNFLAFKKYKCGTFWQHYMVLGNCVQYLWPFWDRILTENLLLVKTLKHWVCSKIMNLDSFSLKFSHNTYITNTNMEKKQNFKKFQILALHEEIPILPDFSNFGPQFRDREFIMVL